MVGRVEGWREKVDANYLSSAGRQVPKGVHAIDSAGSTGHAT